MALRKAKRPLTEFALIRTIARRFSGRAATPLIRGIGDDAAVVAASSQCWWHMTTDLLAEGVHFDLRTASPESIGYRAAVANLSDIAAMGATPRYLLISLAIPRRVQATQIYRIYQGLTSACGRHGVHLIGGDTSASESGLFLSITLVGTSSIGHALFRSGARIGDRIYVTGTLGDSLAGLQLLNRGQGRLAARRVGQWRQAFGRALVNRHLHPTARLKEGQWLNQAGLATAAIDLSDGLSGDLRHLCEESHVGAVLDLDCIPISSACRAYAESRRLNPVHLALTGGEDYELLFAVPAAKQRTLERQAQRRGYRITCIGSICARRYGMRMRVGSGSPEPLPVTSYEHFR